MAGIVEYIISLQDRLSIPLGKLSKNSALTKGQLDKLTESNKKLRSMVQPTSMSISDMTKRVAKLKEQRDLLPSNSVSQIRKVNKEINSLNGKIKKLETINGGKIKTAFKSAFDQIPAIFKNPIVAVGAGMAASLNAGMKASRDKLDFKILAGNDIGTKLFGDLKGSKIKSIMGDAVTEAGKGMLASGISADSILPTLNKLADVSGGSGDKLMGLSQAFGKLNKEGKLTESVLSEMEANGFRPLDIMSRATGKSMAKLMKEMEDGKISIKDIEGALDSATAPGGQFYDVINRIANEPTGKWDILKNKISGFAEKVGEKMMPLVDFVLNGLNIGFEWLMKLAGWVSDKFRDLADFVERNAEWFATLGIAVMAGVTAFQLYNLWQKAVWLWTMKDMVATALMTTIKGAATLVTGGLTGAVAALNAAFWANPVGIVIGLIVGLIAAVILAWENFEGFRKSLFSLWEVFKTVMNNIADLFADVFGPIIDVFESIKSGDFFSAGKALFKLNPISMAARAIDSMTNGTITKGVGEAWDRGQQMGADSFAESQKNGGLLGELKTMAKKFMGGGSPVEDNGLGTLLPDLTKPDKDKGLGASDSINAVSGGGAKNITVTVGKMIETLSISVSGGTREAGREIERIVEESMVRALASATAR